MIQELNNRIFTPGIKFVNNVFARGSRELKVVAVVTALAVAVFAAVVLYRSIKTQPIRALPRTGAAPIPVFNWSRNTFVSFSSPPAEEWKDTPAFKLDLMQRVQAVFEARKEAGQLLCQQRKDRDWQKTADTVYAYILDTILRLSEGEDVPIPYYYHASRAKIDDICAQSLLKASSIGLQGAGVYFSTTDEGDDSSALLLSGLSYGLYTIAFDPSLVEKMSVTYAPSGVLRKTWEEEGLWMCATGSDIKLDPKKVAFLIVPDDQKQEEKHQRCWDVESETPFPTFIVLRRAADEIRSCIRAAHTHYIPEGWRQFSSNHIISLKHIVKGT